MRDWPHSPLHRLAEAGTYMVTAGTYLKQPFFRAATRLDYLCENLLTVAEKHGWSLQAWAVFPNHYHFIAVSPTRPDSLTELTKHLHSVTGTQANRWDQVSGRKVLLPILGNTLDEPEGIFRATELCAQECGAPRGGAGALCVPVVFGRVVPASSEYGVLQDDHGDED